MSYARLNGANRPAGLLKLSVGFNVLTVALPLGLRLLGAPTLTVDPSGFTADSSADTPLGDTSVCGVPEQLATASAHTSGQASMDFLCIEQILLIAVSESGRRVVPSPAERPS
jgi:hypothetical protein